jgi:hypothetical protein
MRKIFKYNVPVDDNVTTLKMPMDADIVHVASQNGDPTSVQFWAYVFPDNEQVERNFVVVGTGHNIPDVNVEYLGAAICYGGQLVWHLLELL